MSRTKIDVELWPRGFMFEGKRTDPEDRFKCHAPYKLSLPPGDMELLIVEWKATPTLFEQEGARSLEAALREWQEEVAAENDVAQTADYSDHEEHRVEPEDMEVEYGENT